MYSLCTFETSRTEKIKGSLIFSPYGTWKGGAILSQNKLDEDFTSFFGGVQLCTCCIDARYQRGKALLYSVGRKQLHYFHVHEILWLC